MFTNLCLVPLFLVIATLVPKFHFQLTKKKPQKKTGKWSDIVKSPLRNSSKANAEEFYYSFYYNEGLENKFTRAPFLGLPKSIYYLMECNIKQNLKDSTQI